MIHLRSVMRFASRVKHDENQTLAALPLLSLSRTQEPGDGRAHVSGSGRGVRARLCDSWLFPAKPSERQTEEAAQLRKAQVALQKTRSSNMRGAIQTLTREGVAEGNEQRKLVMEEPAAAHSNFVAAMTKATVTLKNARVLIITVCTVIRRLRASMSDVRGAVVATDLTNAHGCMSRQRALEAVSNHYPRMLGMLCAQWERCSTTAWLQTPDGWAEKDVEWENVAGRASCESDILLDATLGSSME